MKKVKFEDKGLENDVDRLSKKIVRKGPSHEQHLPRYGLNIDDDYLKDALSKSLSNNPLFNASEVTIKVHNKIASVYGRMPDRLQHDFLIEAIKKHEGVDEVEDHLAVEQEWTVRRKLDPEVTQDYD